MRTFRTAPIRNRGYTLIEMTVVTVILAIFAGLLTPSYVNIRDTQKRKAFFTSVVDLAATARELAISHNATMYVKVESSQNRIEIMQENNDTTYQAADGNSGTSLPTTTANGQSVDNNAQSNIASTDNDHTSDTVQVTLDLPSGVQFGNFQLAGNSSDASSWKVHFYADGTAESGGVELNNSGAVKTLVINPKGGVSLVDGTFPDTSTAKWQAGNYVQRQQ